MNKKIEEIVRGFVKGPLWRKPIVGFCSADEVSRIKRIIPNHILPEEVLKGARSVIVYFIPFTRYVVRSNVRSLKPSRIWEKSYVLTNNLIERINLYIAKKLEIYGFKSYSIKPTHNFDIKTLTSNWSHKHIAYLAGLGNFGHHTMLITEKGCCGRIGSLVTQAEFDYGEPVKEDYCIYRRHGECLKCVSKCPFGALTVEGLDKRRCYEILMKNYSQSIFKADVCGKCACGVPCSLKKPS